MLTHGAALARARGATLALACGATLAFSSLGAPGRASAQGGSDNDRITRERPMATVADTTVLEAGALSAERWADHLYRLAVSRYARRDYAGALALLETIPLQPGSASADRAAFLLSSTYLRLGHRGRLVELSQSVSGWPSSGFTRWIHARAAMAGVRGGIAAPSDGRSESAADLLVVSWLLSEGAVAEARTVLASIGCANSEGQAFALHLRGIADELGGNPSWNTWENLSRLEPRSDLDRSWIGGARLRLATRALEQGDDPRPFLGDRKSSPLDSWGEHVVGLWHLERGESEAARAAFLHLSETWPDYPRLRSVKLALASIALAMEDPLLASALAHEAESSRVHDLETLDGLAEDRALDELWTAWERGGGFGEPVLLDIASLRDQTSQWTHAALAPAAATPADSPALPSRAWLEFPVASAALVPLPDLESLRAVAAAEEASWEAYFEVERARADIATTRTRLDRQRAYLIAGQSRTDAEIELLRDSASALSSVRRKLPDLEDALRELRDEAIRRIEERTEALRRRIDTQRRWVEALERVYVEGPDRPVPGPEDVPRPSELLDREDVHALAADETLRAFAETVPATIARSYDEIWRPRLTDGVSELEAELASLLARATRVQQSIAGQLALIERSDEMADRHEGARRLAEEADLRALGHLQLRRNTTRLAVERARESLAAEAEGIDYLAALSSYEAGLMTEAFERHSRFLEEHPQAHARPDTRYRLADLLMTQERDRFQMEMARFLETGEGLPPIFDATAAQTQYATILRESPQFQHRDAVLFQLGVLEADAGDPLAVAHLGSLLEEHPGSNFRQEAELRLADYLSDDGRRDQALSLYEAAARGSNRGLAAVALYKLGWSRFRGDAFAAAADAFRRTLDLYLEGLPADERKIPDLRRESEDYLVHCLARLGGGRALADYFDGIGPRAYEAQVFTEVTLLLRRFSLFTQAAETDRIWLDRYPLDERAPRIAERLIESLEQAQRTTEANRNRLDLAERFLPGSVWNGQANSDSLRGVAESFARRSLRSVAWAQHRTARSLESADLSAGDSEPHWREALALYERITSIWPDSPEASRDRFQAGEAALRLGVYDRAFAHYTAAAESDTARFAPEAQWQRVAVLDAWYFESGRDSLAQAFVDLSGEYLDRNLADDRAAGLSWRRAHVALDHNWATIAAAELGRFVERFPGDDRVARAAALRGDALLAEAHYDRAARAYEVALRLAGRSGDEDLVDRLEVAIPATEFQFAQSVEAARRALLFREMAERWPEYEHADLALYQSGLAYRDEHRFLEAAEAWSRLLARYPESDYGRDTELELGRAWSDGRRPVDAARVFQHFAESRSGDPAAADALLKSAELWDEAGDSRSADRVRLDYVDRYPEDRETARALLEPMATAVIDRRPTGISVDELVATSPALTRYVKLVADDPGAAPSGILSQLAFLRGEAARDRYFALTLDQPIQESIVVKKEALAAVLEFYRDCATRAVAPWAHAATFRIGEALVEFGQDLESCEPPSKLSGEDVDAYLAVLDEQAWDFYDRGEEVWSDLLRSVRDRDLAAVSGSEESGPEKPGGKSGPEASARERSSDWIRRTQEALWMRVPLRFLHFAEVDYPVVAAEPPAARSERRVR